MFDAIKPLLESGLINEEIGQELNEAWDSKLVEAREQVRTELREEFAIRYEHDRIVMVEALDKMVTEGLSSEIVEFHKKMEAMVIDRTWKKDERGFEKFEKLVNKSDPKSTSIPKKTMLFDNDIREQKMEYFKSELQDCNTRIYNCLQITPVNDQLLDELKEYRRELMTFMSHC